MDTGAGDAGRQDITATYGGPWSDAMMDDLAVRWNAMQSSGKIAEVFSQVYGREISRSAVMGKVKRHPGCVPRPSGHRAAASGVPWSDAEKEVVRLGAARGATFTEMARDVLTACGTVRTPSACSNLRCREGYPTPVITRGPCPGAQRPRSPRENPFDRVNARRALAKSQAAATQVQAPPSASLIQAPSRPFVRLTHGGRSTAVSVTGPHGVNTHVWPVRDSIGVRLLDLEDGQCRMTISKPDAPEMLFCGCRCERGGRGRFESFCVEHGRVAYQASKPRQIALPRPVLRGVGFEYARRDFGRRDYGL